MSTLRVENITKLDGSPFFPDLSPFLLKEAELTGSPFFAQSGFLYLVHNANVIYLPENPQPGAKVAFADRDSNFSGSPVVLLPSPGSGHTVGGSSSLTLNKPNQAVGLLFSEGNWVVTWDSRYFDSAGAGGLNPILTSATTLSAQTGNLYLLNGTTQVLLPPGTTDARVAFADYSSRFGQEAYHVTITPSSLQTIGGSSSYVLNRTNQYVEFLWRNSRWVVIESDLESQLQDGSVLFDGLTFPNQGLKIQDSNGGPETLTLSLGEVLSANRTLSLDTNDSDRSLTITGDASIEGINTGDQTIQLIGQVVGGPSDSVVVTSIVDNGVGLTNLEQINPNFLLGRLTPGEGDVELVGFDSLRDSIAGVNTLDLVQLEDVNGNPGLPAVDGSQLTGLTSNIDQILVPSTEIEFGIVDGDKISATLIDNSIARVRLDSDVNATLTKADELYYTNTDVKTAAYSANTNEAVLCDTSSGSFAVTLPLAGRVKIVDAGGDSQTTGFGINPLTVLPQVGQTIVSDSSLVLDAGITSITLELVGTDWKVVDLVVPKIQVIDWDFIVNKPSLATEAQGLLAETALQPNEPEIILAPYTFNGGANISRINGIEYLIQTVEPVSRGDGSALQDGDLWYDPSTGRQWIRKGIYWLGEREKIFAPFTSNNGTLNSVVHSSLLLSNEDSLLYFEDFLFIIDGDAAFNIINASNYYTIGVKASWTTTGYTTLFSFDTSDMSGTKSMKKIQHNTAVSFSSSFSRAPRITVQIDAITGSPGVSSQQFAFNYYYRKIYA